jgi:HK97 family phage major capsid protein
VKKLYKVLKAFGGHAENATLEFDADDVATKGMVAAGFIEEAPATVAEGLVAESLSKFEKSVSEVVNAASAKLDTAAKALSSKGPRIEVTADEADKKKSFRDFIYCLGISALSEIQPDERMEARERLEKVYGSKHVTWSKATQKAALAEGSGITGGYTTAPQFSNDLLRIAIEDAVLASRARMVPCDGPEVHYPALDQTTPSGTAGQTSYTGGMVAGWTGEAATRQETEPKFKSVILKPNELSGYTLASRNLLRDNIIALETMLTDLIRDTVKWYIDYGCIQGTGVNQPLGILNAPALVTATRATANKFQLADAATMMGKLLPQSRRKAVWLLAPDVFPQLVQLADSSGRVVFLPNMVVNPNQGSAQVAPDDNMVLLGRPVFFTEKLPALGTTGDAVLVDPSMILLAQRMELEIAASEHYKFVNNQMTWRFVTRVDAQPWMDLPLTLQDQSRTLSPYVALHS